MRIGILGAGDMGRTHARIFAAMPEVEVAGITGRSRERVEQVAGGLNIRGLTEPWALLDDESIDAIDVAYPSALHREWVLAALERGKHVFCETPMALTVEEISLVRYPSKGEPEALTAEGSDPYTAECAYFVRCIRGEADPARVSPEGERDALRVVLAAERAIVEGAVITLGQA
jgi:predicted dehydrogenase